MNHVFPEVKDENQFLFLMEQRRENIVNDKPITTAPLYVNVGRSLLSLVEVNDCTDSIESASIFGFYFKDGSVINKHLTLVADVDPYTLKGVLVCTDGNRVFANVNRMTGQWSVTDLNGNIEAVDIMIALENPNMQIKRAANKDLEARM